jgi:hypothetical protein
MTKVYVDNEFGWGLSTGKTRQKGDRTFVLVLFTHTKPNASGVFVQEQRWIPQDVIRLSPRPPDPRDIETVKKYCFPFVQSDEDVIKTEAVKAGGSYDGPVWWDEEHTLVIGYYITEPQTGTTLVIKPGDNIVNRFKQKIQDFIKGGWKPKL